MNIKRTIKNHLPKRYVYSREYRVRAKRANKTYAEAEKELDASFERTFGRKIDWENPKTYNEKLNVAKLYASTPLKTRLTDKILVADWVKERLAEVNSKLPASKQVTCEFIPLLATYDSIDQIDFTKLPGRYVMKMNNDSGSVFIHDEKHPVTKDVIAKYKYYFQKRNYAYNGYEMQYLDIKPKIMIEKYMGGAIRDYKFACFDGKCASCRVDFDRFGDHTRNFYDRNWKLLPFNKGPYENYPEPVKKPTNFEEMWRLAEILADGFDQVRVDFYDIDGVVYFGEMTFTNGNGTESFTPPAIDERMGSLWHLDMSTIRKRRAALREKKIL